MRRERIGFAAALVAALAVIAPLAWLWQASLVPSTYSVMQMGYVDLGGGVGPANRHSTHGSSGSSHADSVTASTSVEELTGPRDREPDVSFDLTTRKEQITLASGRQVEGYTVNGRSPGPELRVRQGQLVEVRLRNASVPDGVTLHWHGIDVPNAEDGVAGVTQDAVPVGEQHVYRFVAEEAGTYWYHTHQVSHRQVVGGLLGAVVVEEPVRAHGQGQNQGPGHAPDLDVVALTHTYSGTRTLNGHEGAVSVPARAGDVVRLRVVNTDNGPVEVWADTGYRVLAVDGRDLNRPGVVEDQRLTLTGGGRADLMVVVPVEGLAVRVQVGAATAAVLGPRGTDVPPAPERPEAELDLLHYGEPAPVAFDASDADREFDYSIGRRPGFVDGRPGVWWSINGNLFPDVPMYLVREGDVVRMRIENNSGDVHPMHLHGHHALVLSRGGEAATGSPWWTDSLDVKNGETYEIAFLADNPGIWMDHCHNLEHAAEGLVAHLMYEGVSTPYMVGGEAGNRPE